MGIFSWFGSRKSASKPGKHRKGPPSLVRVNEESPKLQRIEEAAAEDVARVREDDKYFDRDAPANQDEL
jgi:hypothetical protein